MKRDYRGMDRIAPLLSRVATLPQSVVPLAIAAAALLFPGAADAASALPC